ncbi:MAG: adenosine deaminase family protein [Candidatus Aegiribacteria sp.]|nr:adenosine deaminase family protein [Candidatus Aegiribacteria sp.]
MNHEFLKKLPKTDLHMHLDGSVRISTLIELARESKIDLPSYTEQGLRETVFKEQYKDLDEYLTGFAYTTAVMKTREQLERISYEVAVDNQQEGVRYVEVRFAPQLHASDEMDIVGCIRAVNDGLLRAKVEFNSRSEVKDGLEPPFHYGIIACAMRFFTPAFSDWYRKFFEMHHYTHRERVFALASLELEAAVARARWEEELPVVGIDLAGSEAGWPALNHLEAFSRAQRHFLKKTVHAGEAYGPESIYQAITDLYADRIGHGLTLLDPGSVKSKYIRDPEKYVDELAGYIADRRITVEVCLTSNQQTNPAFRNLSNHPFRKMMDRKLSVTICTDNRTISNTTVTKELHKAVNAFDLTKNNLKNILVYGFKRSFFPGRYDEKRQYVRKCMEYFEKVEKEYFQKKSNQ